MTNDMEPSSKSTGSVPEMLDGASKLSRTIAKYFGATISELDGFFADWLKKVRYERAIRLIDQVDLFLTNREMSGITRPVPAKLVLPIFQEASLEEDDGLQDRWAALLANALDPQHTSEIRQAYISILKDLSALDAKNLDEIYSKKVVPLVEDAVYTTLLPARVTQNQEGPQKPSPDIETSLANLGRLGLITTGMAWGGYSIYSCVYRTSLGKDFINAVSQPERAA